MSRLKVLKVHKLTPETPPINRITRKHPFLLLRALETVTLEPQATRLIRTGIKVKLPQGTYAHLQLHTNFLENRGLHLVDPILHPQHEGEVMVLCVNRSDHKITVKAGRKIVWVTIAPYSVPSEIIFKDNFEQKETYGLHASSV